MKFKYLTKDKASKLPKNSGVYCFKRGAKLLYIGKATNIKERVKEQKSLARLAKEIGYIKTKSEIKALLLEAKLIKKYQPKYNVAWKDDKNYFYIGITKEEFPRIFITHQPIRQTQNKTKLKTINYKLKTEYVGPFVDGKSLKRNLKELRKLFPYRTCKTLPKKPCLWYHLNQCPAPCLFRSRRIEAYDISNIQGKDATGSMVTFINAKPDKNFYRRFKIKGISSPNDIGMLKEVLSRRFNHPEWDLPDLILIDGGIGQLNVALKVKRQSASRRTKLKTIRFISLAKKENKLYIEGYKNPIPLKNFPREIFNLILQLRDEAHRFAITYHKKLRYKALIPK